jgi:hypothetical protein
VLATFERTLIRKTLGRLSPRNQQGLRDTIETFSGNRRAAADDGRHGAEVVP